MTSPPVVSIIQLSLSIAEFKALMTAAAAGAAGLEEGEIPLSLRGHACQRIVDLGIENWNELMNRAMRLGTAAGLTHRDYTL